MKKESVIKFDKIIEELYAENNINEEDYINKDLVRNNKDIINFFLKIGLEESILYKKISKFFNYKEFKFSDKSKEDVIFVTDDGVFFRNTYYLRNPFTNILNKINVNNKKYNNFFFDNIGIITKAEYKKCLEFEKQNKKDFVNDKSLKIIRTKEVVVDAIEKEFDEIIINEGNNFIMFKKNNNTVVSSFDTENRNYIFESIIEHNNIKYFIETKKITDKIYIIYVNNHEEILDLKKYEKRYISEIESDLKSSNGLYIFSEKYKTNFYHYFLKHMFYNNKEKSIVSIERKSFFLDGVLQLSKDSSLEDIDIDNFDIIFIEDIRTIEEYNLMLNALILGKFVFINIISQDAINSLYTILNKHKGLVDPKFISEKLISSYHATKIPKVCDNCSEEVLLYKHSLRNDPQFSLLFSTNDIYKTSVKRANHNGCGNCEKGYTGYMLISEVLSYDKDLAYEMENNYNIRLVRNMKNSKRWETILNSSINQILKHNLSLDDVKSKL